MENLKHDNFPAIAGCFANSCPIITVTGPTATGKTHIAVRLAAELDGEIISADSRQLYRRMDIGTGKDLSEYVYKGREIPHYMIDVEDPGEEFNVFRYQQGAYQAMKTIAQHGKRIILCGGSGMYVEAVLRGYGFSSNHQNDELSATARTLPSVIIGLRGDRDLIRSRITARLQARLHEGLVEEIRQLIASGVSSRQLLRYGLEYKFVTRYLQGELDEQEMFENLNTAIHQFSKRQMTWFRRMERQGFTIHWIDIALPEEEKMNSIYTILAQNGL